MTHHPKRKDANNKGRSLGHKGKRDKKGRVNGSPTKLTNERRATICQAIRLGNFKWVAAHLAAISESTLKVWVQKGEGEWTDSRTGKQPAPKEPYKGFAIDFRDAECEAEARAVAIVEEASTGFLETENEEWYETKNGERSLVRDKKTERLTKDWHAAAFLLERRSAERWGRRRHLEVQTQVGDLKQVIVVHSGPAPHPDGLEDDEP